MKCVICGQEFSDKVYRIHIKRCKAESNKIDYLKELKEYCKKNKIKSYRNKNIEEIINIIIGCG